MTYFNRGGGDSRSQFYGSNSRGDRGGFGGNSERREMFDAVCAKCGASCQVPFKPNGRKEVFCSKCFGEMNGEEPRGGNRFENRGSRSFGDRDARPRFDKPMFNAICDECGDNCQVPFEPRNGNPVLCSNCFAKKEGRGNDSRSFSPKVTGNLDLSEINAKLDKIIKLLSPETPKEITKKILETIEETSGKEVAAPKKKAKVAKKKADKE